MTTRHFLVGALAACLAAGPAVASAQNASPNRQAETLNEEGKALYKNGDYAGAAEKFRAAIQIEPNDPRYYFNLCATLEKAGDYEGALQACDEVYRHGADERLRAKTGERAAEIRRKKRERDSAGGGATGGGPAGQGGVGGAGGANATGSGGADGGAGSSGLGGGPGGSPGSSGGAGPGGTGPGPGDASGGGTPGGGVPPSPGGPADGSVQSTFEPAYNWSVGGEIGGVFHRLGNDSLAKAGGGLRLYVDHLSVPRANVGFRAFLGVASFAARANRPDQEDTSIVDLGGAIFHHRRIAGNLFVTPLAGVQLSLLTPEASSPEGDAFLMAALRLEAALQFVVADRHVLSFVPLSLTAYSRALTDAAGLPPSEFGLDRGGVAWAITVGYTVRFRTPAPALIVLE